jgi:Virulence-associated protein E-like domain
MSEQRDAVVRAAAIKKANENKQRRKQRRPAGPPAPEVPPSLPGVTCETFIRGVFGYPDIPDDERVILTIPDPNNPSAAWGSYPVTDSRLAKFRDGAQPWYFGVATYRPPGADGYLPRRREHAVAAYCIVLDDIGTKVKEEPPVGPSWKLESSEGNFQWGYRIHPCDVTTPVGTEHFEACQRGLADAGYTDSGARGTYRVMRVPGSLHRTGFVSRVTEWHPERIWDLDELMAELGVEPAKQRTRTTATVDRAPVALEDIEDPVYDWLVANGHTTGETSDKFVEIICPWASDHSTPGDVAGYTPMGYDQLQQFDRAFSCFHQHCIDSGRDKKQFLAWVAEQGGPNLINKEITMASPINADEIVTFDVPDPLELPDVVMTATGQLAATQLTTSDNVRYVLKELGIGLRYNRMTGLPVFVHPAFTPNDNDQNQVRLLVQDMLTRLRIKSLDRVEDMYNVIAQDGSFHPMVEWIDSKPWDGKDRLAALAATVPTESKLWPVYLRKWLIQAAEAVRGGEDGVERSLPHVLVFVGGQGSGKGRWMRQLAPGFVLADAELHLNSMGAKDQQITVLKYPIAELGEIDSTFKKSEVSALKAFLSRPVDELRQPYARRAIRRPRGTVFAGSVNDATFLNDTTGSRRFWPFELTGMPVWDHGIDMQQVWAQVSVLWKNGEDWNLGDKEDRLRVIEARAFTVVPPEVDMVAGHWELYHHQVANYAVMNKTEIMRVCGIRNPSMAATAHVTEWLTAKLGKPRKLLQRTRCWLFPIGNSAGLVPGVSTVPRDYAQKHVGPFDEDNEA